ncbi:hypothetical protein [Streptomyces omiyaensis]|uniref:hypothetical protein n=1 Tax=Streptomyces omiyaensis TaxID=68247 RepID=UPI0036FF7D46
MQDEERGWLIPVEALLAAGFRLNAPAPAEDAAVPAAEAVTASVPVGEDVAGVRAELERERERQALLHEVAQARHEAALAAAEVGNLRDQLAARDGHIEDLRSALRALSPAPERTALGEPVHQTVDSGVVVPGQGQGQSRSEPPASADTAAAAGAEDGARRRRWGGGGGGAAAAVGRRRRWGGRR